MKLHNNIILNGNDKILLTPIQMSIFKTLLSNTHSRKELCASLDTARTTIYDNLEKLHEIKIDKVPLVMLYVKYKKGVGRPIWGRPVVYWYIPRKIKKLLNGVKNGV